MLDSSSLIPFLQEQNPNLSQESLKQTAERLHDYLQIIIQIVERLEEEGLLTDALDELE